MDRKFLNNLVNSWNCYSKRKVKYQTIRLWLLGIGQPNNENDRINFRKMAGDKIELFQFYRNISRIIFILRRLIKKIENNQEIKNFQDWLDKVDVFLQNIEEKE